ncbi:hypothetical protein KOI35_33350 [Actinoplanes bogorensis]|uniref:LPXTG cell wall anchor domain-containing protein n=1 Tax=Paractinoplanes bogorensis TaxID=1610840 RepID=A0ABS5YYA0_9ACTN|nr:hypothetical protein [Actinoplanes bogorensis]MBU2668411.1 hypothetical protein [Actinoplanes bogorensis]
MRGLALIAVLAALIPAAPAQAAPGQKLRMDNVSVSPGGPTKLIRATFTAPADNQAPPFDVVFDITAAAELVTIKPYGPCTTTATTITCKALRGTFYESPLDITAKPGAAIGARAELPVRAVADGTTLASATGTVTIAESTDLVALQLQDDITVATGATFGLSAGVRNESDRPVTGVVLELGTVRGLDTAAHSNCARAGYATACHFDTELAPGQEYRLSTPLQITATDETWAPSRWQSSFNWYTDQDWADGDRTIPTGSGPELTLEPVVAARAVPQTDPQNNNNSDFWVVTLTGSNRSNFTARGAEASAQVGDTITVRVGVHNNGPARLEGYGAALGSYLTVGVTPPAGTTVVKAPALCEPYNVDGPLSPPWPPGAAIDDGNYYCFHPNDDISQFDPGKTVTWEFKLRVTRPGTLRGKIFTHVVAPSQFPQGDPDPADDDAAIVINATGAGGGTGGGLPITGTNTAVVALIGLALLLAGAVTRVATRRR